MKILPVLLIALALMSGNLFAQNPSISVGQDEGAVGSEVSVPLNWNEGGSTYTGVEFRVGFDETKLTFVGCALNAPYDGYNLAICRLAGTGNEVEVGLIDNILSPGPVPTGELGNITFSIGGSAVSGDVIPLTVQGIVLPGNPTADTTDGQITVLGPAYSSTPLPGSTQLSSVVQNGPDLVFDVEISNTGVTGSTLTVQCSETSDPDNLFSVSPTTQFTVAQGDAPAVVEVACDSSGPIGIHTATMECTHDGDSSGAASPASYDFSCQITAGPQPTYTSTPAPGSTLSMDAPFEDDPITPVDVAITNTGDAGSTLTGSCSLSGASQITLSGGAFSVDEGAAASIQSVSCDSSAEGTYNATLSCGPTNEATPATYTYPVVCTVGAAREPAFSSTPAAGQAIALDAPQEGDPITPVDVTITNSGDPQTTLTGSCSLSGDTQISLTGGAFSVDEGGAASVQSIACDSTAEGDYNAVLSCTHDGGAAGAASPATYAVSCSVGPAGAAVFESTPAAGATIDLAAGLDPYAGQTDPDPTAALEIRNGTTDANDNDLELLTCALTGDAAITVSTDLSGSMVAPNGSTSTTFSCATTTAGSFTAQYSCTYSESGDSVQTGTADYDLACTVRDAESVVTTDPASGTTVSGQTVPGGTAQLSVLFNEEGGEGVDGTIDSCALDDGTNFSVVSPASFPATVAAGSSVTVTVEATDPGDGSGLTDTLRCTFSDSDDSQTEAVFPLQVSIGIVNPYGIPTLSQYGLALLALLMLGVGLVGFRRYT